MVIADPRDASASKNMPVQRSAQQNGRWPSVRGRSGTTRPYVICINRKNTYYPSLLQVCSPSS